MSISASFPIALFIWSGIANRWQKLFFLQMPNCNGDNFQKFLDDFSLQESKELVVIVLDNGAFHKAKSLKIPENIILIFLPPYSPELNLLKKYGQSLKVVL